MLKIFNTLSKNYTPLPSIPLGTWYMCGPTVYDNPHLGHAKTYVQFDIIKRILKKFSHNFLVAMSITDIDEKILNRSKEENIRPWVLAQKHENSYFHAMQQLNVQPPDIKLRVSEHIPLILRYVQSLINNGTAYTVQNGNVYFDSQKYKHKYGVLQKVSQESSNGDEPKGPVEFAYEANYKDPFRKHPSDFALWKTSLDQTTGQTETNIFDAEAMITDLLHSKILNNSLLYGETNKSDNSNNSNDHKPRYYGRPGWHIECSTMANLVFGPRINIHSGGRDLIFPHHENEIAQCASFYKHYKISKKPIPNFYLKNNADRVSVEEKYTFADIWMHTGLLQKSSDSAKMSKSLKNTISLTELFSSNAQLRSDHFRILCLLHHYRKPLFFDITKSFDLPSKILEQIDTFLYQTTAYNNSTLCSNLYSQNTKLPNVFINGTENDHNNDIHLDINTDTTNNPIDEVLIDKLLTETSNGIDQDLRMDFDTPSALQKLLGFITTVSKAIESNLKNLPHSQDVFYSRSPYVITKAQKFVKETLDTFGLNFAGMETERILSTPENHGNGSEELNNENLINLLLKFRSEVRHHCLSDGHRFIKSDPRDIKERLLQSCDDIRENLQDLGLDVKDTSTSSTLWKMNRKI